MEKDFKFSNLFSKVIDTRVKLDWKEMDKTPIMKGAMESFED